MIGTKTFPALRIEDYNMLPKQKDDFSCGVAVFAGTAIILRDIIGVDGKHESFQSMFCPAIMDVRFCKHTSKKNVNSFI